MTNPIGYCHQCGTAFEARGFATFKNSTDITFVGNTTKCPSGHRGAVVLDGTFNFVNDTVQLVSGPAFTREIFARFMTVVSEARQDVTAGELAKEANKVHPALGHVVETVSGGDPSKRGPAFLVTVAAVIYLLATKCSITLDLNRAVDQIRGLPPTEGQTASPDKIKTHEHKDGANADPTKKRP